MKLVSFFLSLSVFATTTFAWSCHAAADDVFYAVSRVDSKTLGTTPKAVTAHGRPEKVLKASLTNDVIIRHNIEKNERVEVLRVNDEIQSFSLSAKGDRLTYMVRAIDNGNSKRENWTIIATDLEGNAIGRLNKEQYKTQFKGYPFGPPTLSPDDSTILFSVATYQESTDSTIYRMGSYNLKSKTVVDLGKGLFPSWSPDGSKILYTTVVGTRPLAADYHLEIMSSDGSKRQAFGEKGSLDGSFSSDGKMVAFIKIVAGGSEVWTCKADGTGAEKVEAPKSHYSSPRLLGKGRRLSVAALHADMLPAVNDTISRLKAKGGSVDGRMKNSNSKKRAAAANSDELRDVYLISTENKNVRWLTQLDSDTPSDIDLFVDKSIQTRIANAAARQAERDFPVYVPPVGWTARIMGTKVLLVDTKTKATKPMPDGRFRLTPGGRIILVTGGEKTIPNFGIDDDDE